MGDGLRKINERARETGKTREEVLKEALAELLGEPEPTGLRKWVETIKKPFRRVSAIDRENRRIFDQNQIDAAKAGTSHASPSDGPATPPGPEETAALVAAAIEDAQRKQAGQPEGKAAGKSFWSR